MITLQKYTRYYKGIQTNASTSLMYFTMNYMHITVCKTSISPQNIVLYRSNSVNGCVSNVLPMHSVKIFFGSTEGVTCMREVINAHNSHLRSWANPCATRTCGYKDYIRADMWALTCYHTSCSLTTCQGRLQICPYLCDRGYYSSTLEPHNSMREMYGSS